MRKKGEVKDYVYNILKEIPEARNSDENLYLRVCMAINPNAVQQPFWHVMMNRNGYDLPPFESIRRARQKLQSTFPELAGSPEVEEYRSRMEEEIREWSVS